MRSDLLDEDKVTDDGAKAPVFKPDWSHDLFRSTNSSAI